VRRRRLVAFTVGAVVVVGAGVGGIAVATAGAGDSPTPSEAATDRACARAYVQLDAMRPRSKEGLRVSPLGAARLPAALALDPTRAGRAFLGERAGRVRVVDGSTFRRDVVLDLTADTNSDGDGGLLAMAVDPAGKWLYVYRTTVGQDDVITAYPLDGGGLPDVDGEVVVVEVDHPRSPMHHGGALGFGPDGFLYIGFGDGGGLGDPRGNAQDPSTLLGKVIRIDPTPGAAEPYRVPADNPFVGRDRWRPEIWLLGLRNPFRLTFDAATGDLWVGDVGQSCWEELDRLRPEDAGANLGWDHREGTAAFEGGDVPGRSVEPVHTYSHRGGNCAVVAGVVLRGAALPSLDGWILYTDYCNGRIMAFRPGAGGEPPRLFDTGARVDRPVAIAWGPDGGVWVLSLEGPVYRLEERNQPQVADQ
jgi:glucose/arabinose dehydrogenase